MAHHRYENTSQPRQQQHYDQVPAQPGYHSGDYNDQYAEQYDYDRGQEYADWDNGHYYNEQHQHGGWANVEDRKSVV